MSSISTPLKLVDQCLSSSIDSTTSSEDLKHQPEILEFVEGDSCGYTENVHTEDLKYQFTSLSALLPNPTKMDDMTSVLEEAINYINQLDGQVKELEKLSETLKANAQESDMCVTTSGGRGPIGVACSSSYKTNSTDIEVEILEKRVLVRIKCEKKSSSLVSVLEELLKSGVCVTSVNTVPIANTTIFIDIVAEMRDGVYMTPTDLLKNLQQVL